MTFNPLKCKHLQITKKQQPVTSEYCLNNSIIKQVNTARYLGVIINLNWNEHTVEIVNKANSVLSFLHHNLKQYSPHIKALAML